MGTIKLKTFTTVSKCSKYLVGFTWKHVGVVKPKIMFHHTGVTSSSLNEATKSHANHKIFGKGFNFFEKAQFQHFISQFMQAVATYEISSVPAFYLAVYASNSYISVLLQNLRLQV